jgi:RNA polymerase sigma-70 factor (ECF subfamily)
MSELEAAAGAAISDEEVVRRVRAGEHELFEILMRRYNQRLYRVARSIVKNEAEAEDVMQQAYVSAYTHLEQFAERARFSTWLTRIAVYEALGRLRRRRRVREVEVAENEEMGVPLRSGEPSPEQQALGGELRRLLEQAVDALPRTSRSAFVLREIEGLSTVEAAECLGVSDEVVKTRLHRARRQLRQELLDRAGIAGREAFAFHATRCDSIVSAVFARLALPRPGPEGGPGARPRLGG